MKTLFSKAVVAIFICFAFISCTKDHSIDQQNPSEHFLGAVPSTPDQLASVAMQQSADILMRPGAGNTLPGNYSMLMPPVGDQGGLPSCVAFAVAYCTRSADKYYSGNTSNYNTSTNI